MTVLNRIKNFVAAFVQPVEAGYAPDSIAAMSCTATIEAAHGRFRA
jgi:hypothetical protein